MSPHPFQAERSVDRALSPRLGEWRAYRGSPRRPCIAASRALSFAAWIAAATTAVGIYNNVIVDDAGLRHRTNELACTHAGCGGQCSVTQMQGRRTVFGYEANYEIDGSGTIAVLCRRSAIIAGDHHCTARTVSSR